ncbi:9273_t:CDS:2, partial [Racocetra fulgida]
FRSQLPKYNPYWPPPNEESNDDDSNEHANRPSEKFTTDDDNLCSKLVLFPEFEVVTEPEGNLFKDGENGEIDDSLSNLDSGNSRALVPVGDEIYENTQVNVDKAFLKFQKKIEPFPDQVLRYARLDYECEKNATPLWVSDIGKPMPEDIPSCSHCGQERTFEFQ